MKISDRAKIFMPFDALNGFREALRGQEKVRVEKINLLDDQIEEIRQSLNLIKKGMMLRIVYYVHQDKNYLSLEGIITNIDEVLRTITIVKTKIKIDDIYTIEIIKNKGFETN